VAHRILVVEDDPHIREIIRFALAKVGMEVFEARDGAEALVSAEAKSPDLIVLDIGLPELDGLEVCRRLRKAGETPILFLSARDEEIDRIVGLELGADDYVVKPFSPRELVARVNAILKRARAAPPAPTSMARGALTLSPEAHEARLGSHELELTALEFAIVRTLLARPNMVFSREKILDAAYGGAVHVADRTIDSHIRNIRAKFAALGCPDAIETVHGVGFRIGRCEPSP
jgi:two-component system OmpR family response regulator